MIAVSWIRLGGKDGESQALRQRLRLEAPSSGRHIKLSGIFSLRPDPSANIVSTPTILVWQCIQSSLALFCQLRLLPRQNATMLLDLGNAYNVRRDKSDGHRSPESKASLRSTLAALDNRRLSMGRIPIRTWSSHDLAHRSWTSTLVFGLVISPPSTTEPTLVRVDGTSAMWTDLVSVVLRFDLRRFTVSAVSSWKTIHTR